MKTIRGLPEHSLCRETVRKVCRCLDPARDYPDIEMLGLDKAIVLQALLVCRSSGETSFADALVWAAARSAGSEVVYSLDERFPADGLDVRRDLNG